MPIDTPSKLNITRQPKAPRLSTPKKGTYIKHLTSLYSHIPCLHLKPNHSRTNLDAVFTFPSTENPTTQTSQDPPTFNTSSTQPTTITPIEPYREYKYLFPTHRCHIHVGANKRTCRTALRACLLMLLLRKGGRLLSGSREAGGLV